MLINCTYSRPVYWDEQAGALVPNEQGGSKPISNWAFSEKNCEILDLPTTTTEIISADNEKSFFLDRTITYGDFLIATFFILFFTFFLIDRIRDFVKNRKLERL